MADETPQHPHALLLLYSMYTSVVLKIKVHNACCCGGAARVSCSAGKSEPRAKGDNKVGRDTGLTDKGHSHTASGQEEQSRSSDRNQGHP